MFVLLNVAGVALLVAAFSFGVASVFEGAALGFAAGAASSCLYGQLSPLRVYPSRT